MEETARCTHLVRGANLPVNPWPTAQGFTRGPTARPPYPIEHTTGVNICAVGSHISSAVGQGAYEGRSPLWGFTGGEAPCAVGGGLTGVYPMCRRLCNPSAVGQGVNGGRSPLWGITGGEAPCAVGSRISSAVGGGLTGVYPMCRRPGGPWGAQPPTKLKCFIIYKSYIATKKERHNNNYELQLRKLTRIRRRRTTTLLRYSRHQYIRERWQDERR